MRTILVTGGSSGIGQAVCSALLERGDEVIELSRRSVAGAPTKNYTSYQLDLCDFAEVTKQLPRILKNHPNISAVVSNAGGPIFGGLESMSPTDIRQAIELNLTSHLMLAKFVLPTLKSHDSSDLLLMGSEAALRGGRHGTLYCAAKFGLRGFAQSLREESAASGLRVSIVHPGMVRTPFFDGLNFRPGDRDSEAIEVGDVASSILHVLDMRPGTVVDEIVLNPLKKVVQRGSTNR